MKDILELLGYLTIPTLCMAMLAYLMLTAPPILSSFEQHIQDRIKAADSMAITAQEKAVRARTEGGGK
jgi:hypothetical protein